MFHVTRFYMRSCSTHLGFQSMLPEAVAIVAAPRDPRIAYGVFRLIEPEGVELVRSRPDDKAYRTPEGVFLYETSSHIVFVTGGPRSVPSSSPSSTGIPSHGGDANLVDLRFTPSR